MRRVLVAIVLVLAGCGSSTPPPDAQAPTPAAPNGVSGTSGPTGAPTVVPATPSPSPSATAAQPTASARSTPTRTTGGKPPAPGALSRCLAAHGVKATGAPPSQEDMTAALAACRSKTAAAATATAAPGSPDRLKACLERNRPARPSPRAVRRVIVKCGREADAG